MQTHRHLQGTLLVVVGAALSALFLSDPAHAQGRSCEQLRDEMVGNGILTIAKGTLPLVLFGPKGYGERQGLLMVPARLAQALAPWLFGVFMAQYGINALWISAGIGLVAAVALLRLAPVQTQ